MFHPLEQFEIILFCAHPFPWTTQNVAIAVLLSFVIVLTRYSKWFSLIPTKYQFLLEKLYLFVLDLVKENIGKSYLYFFNIAFTIFFFILLANLQGMIPYSFATTSHLIVTFVFSLSFFLFLNLLGIWKHGSKIFTLFLPAGAPLLLSPFLVLIELISYIARVFSLAIRLFANIMAGHTLLKILAEFGTIMLVQLRLSFLGAFFPILIVFLVTGLELAIAFLQAYVFTVLICIYLNDALNLH